MIGHELNKLESRIDQVVNIHSQLALENSSLRKKMSQLAKERSALLDKNKKAAKLIRQIVAQLEDEIACQIKK